MQDVWNYDADTKRITDENGLKVANDVVPEDAAVILACREACGLVAAGKVDAAGSTCADALNGGDMLRSIGQPRPPAPRSLWLVLEQMLKWEADQFDGDPSTDLSVSGADLVDAFTEWRTQLRAALEEAPGFKAFDRGYEVGFADGAQYGGHG